MVGLIFGLMGAVIPVIIVIIIIVAIIRKNKDGEKAESFNKVVRMIYIYVLLISFLFMTVGSFIFAFTSAVNYYLPESKIDVSEIRKTSYNNYASMEIQKLKNNNNLRNEKNTSITDLVTAIAMFTMGLPMFVYHGKLAKDLKEA